MILFLAALAAPLSTPAQVGPIRAIVVATDDRVNRPSNESSYERVRVALTNTGTLPAPFRFCARDARFENTRGPVREDSRWFVDTHAFAASVGNERSWRTGCRTVTLNPGVPQRVNFFLRTGVGYGNSRRMVLSTGAGPFLFMPARTRFAYRPN